MQITIKLFAGLAEKIGERQVTVNIPTGATVKELRHYVRLQFPSFPSLFDGVLVAVNQVYALEDTVLQEGSEVALIPPVGGGSSLQPSCLVTRNPLDIAQAYAQFTNSNLGGIVLFCGTVREWTHHRHTLQLQYEAYEAMALTQMGLIETELRVQWPKVQTLQWHRVGVLEPTEIAVICAAAASHREDAFIVAKVLIERLKREVPIWKKEFYANGDALWQPNESL
ncbi:molybdopterin converting factor subunit 1 [Alicyclobacillaceae bacterium I2511]|jgi:molybdopterin synthase catalytic subunit|nr:molybdopterin converting factor subunit 1 [Alicyclobacillaceae bacterium I2511]